MAEPLLEVTDLETHYTGFGGSRVVRAVDRLSFSLSEGQTIGLVGESGCGKTTTCLSLVRLLAHGAEIVGGSIKLAGREITDLSESEMADVRGNEIAMILQDPLTSLNPLFDIAETVLTLAQIVKHLALFEVEEAISKIAGLAEKIESLAKLAPPLSMPVLIIDVIDAIIRYLKATQAQIVRMQGYHERVKSSLEASAETGFDMEDIINCAEASLEDTLAHLGTQADPINRLIGLLNGFLQLLELPCIPSISAPTLDDTFLDLMDTTIEYLEFLRGLIKIPVPFISIGVDEDDC